MNKKLLISGILFLSIITTYGDTFHAKITAEIFTLNTKSNSAISLEHTIGEIPSITKKSTTKEESALKKENYGFAAFNTPATHLNFDGANDYVELPNEADFDFTDQMTVEFWMNSNTTPQQWDVLVAKGDDSWRIALNASGTLNFAGNGGFGSVNSVTNVIDGNWHHVAVTYNKVNAVIYVDGVLDNSVAGTGDIDNSNFNVTIGENLQAQGRYYTGNIEEVRIWNLARTGNQIIKSMNCELLGSEAGLVAYYQFNQGVDAQDNTAITSVTSAVGTSNNATPVNFSLTGSTSNFLSGSPVVTGSTIPSAPSAADQSFCIGARVENLVPAPSTTIKWYDSDTAGSPLGNTVSLNPGFYYVSNKSASGCESDRTPVTITIDEESSFKELRAPLSDGVSSSTSTFSDIDGDLDLDLLITGQKLDINRSIVTILYKNDGAGNFTEVTNTPFVGVKSGSVAFSDVNGDGSDDVLITGDTGSSPITRLYLNDGNGNFTVVAGTPFVDVKSSAIAFSDVDGNGTNDVLITGRVNGSIRESSKLYLNDGNGNFTEKLNTPFAPVEVGSIAFADVNGDTFDDVLITGLDNTNGPNVAKLYINDGNGNFTEDTTAPFLGVFFSSIAFSDVNGNGFKDVLVTGNNTTIGTTIALYINDGLGNFTVDTNSSFASVQYGSIAFADVDGDNDNDVVITGNNGLLGRISKLYINDGSGLFVEDPTSTFVGVHFGTVSIAEIDGINGVDIFLTGEQSSGPNVSNLYINSGSGNFNLKTGPPFLELAFGDSIFSDLDNDGDDDLLIIGADNLGNRAVKYYDNKGNASFSEVLNTPFVGVSEPILNVFDFDNDGDQDVLISGVNGSTPVSNLYLNDGLGNFISSTSPFAATRVGSVAIADVDGINGEDVLVVGVNAAGNGIIAKLYLNNGSGSFTEKPSIQLEPASNVILGFKDLDGVNGIDVIISGQTSNGLETILYNNDGNGNFTKVLNTPFIGIRNGSINFSDVDQDGDQDVIITGQDQSSNNTAKMYLNDGSGNFTEDMTSSFVSVSYSDATFADVDGVNGEDLLIIGESDAGKTALLYINDGSGNFTVATCTPFLGVSYGSLSFSDVDNDSDIDVLFTGRSSNFPSNITKLYINNTIAPSVWSGAVDTDWDNSNNWTNLLKPSATDNAIIRAGTVNKPFINSSTTAQVSSVFTDAGSTLTVNGILKVTKNITNEGQLIFKSNVGNTGQLDEFTGEIFGLGNVQVERYIPSKRAFRFISSPVTTTTSIFENWQEGGDSPTGFGTHITGSDTGANGFDVTGTGNPSLFTFDNSTGAWQAIPNTDVETLNSGTPYRLFVRGDRSTPLNSENPTPSTTILRSSGALITGDFSPQLSTAVGGFSFVGNPYQAVVDFTEVTTSNLSNFLYVWDASVAAQGIYVSVDLSDLGAPVTGSSDANQFIAPGQAFFVRNTASGNGNITFEENDKSTTSSQVTVFSTFTDFYINSQLYKTADLLAGGMESDALGLRFRESYTTAGSDEDAVKFGNPGENYAIVNNGLRSIDKQNIPTDGHEIQLSLDNYTTTGYSLSFDMDNKPANLMVILEDAYLNTNTALTNGLVYDFTIDAGISGSVATDRFKLVFQDVTLSNGSFVLENIRLYPNPAFDQLQIEIPATTLLKSVEFYNMLGQQVLSSTDASINIKSLKAGIYLVSVYTTGGQITKKVIKK
jgi:hypothetical protein